MDLLFDPVNTLSFPNLFTLLWVAAVVVMAGTIAVYGVAQGRYRRYPQILALYEWMFWSLLIPWLLVPLLVIIHVPLLLILVLVVPGLGAAVYGAFIRYPPLIAAANDEIRRRRYVPPARQDPRRRQRPTPAGGHKSHRH